MSVGDFGVGFGERGRGDEQSNHLYLFGRSPRRTVPKKCKQAFVLATSEMRRTRSFMM